MNQMTLPHGIHYGIPDEAPSLTDDDEARIRREIEEENRRAADAAT